MGLMPWLLLISGTGSLLGLLLLQSAHDMEDHQHLLMSMTFGCWLVYCLSRGALEWTPADLEYFISSLRLVAGLSYLLTFVSLLSLPLYAVSLPAE